MPRHVLGSLPAGCRGSLGRDNSLEDAVGHAAGSETAARSVVSVAENDDAGLRFPVEERRRAVPGRRAAVAEEDAMAPATGLEADAIPTRERRGRGSRRVDARVVGRLGFALEQRVRSAAELPD